jgi:predicted transcriptional regulator
VELLASRQTCISGDIALELPLSRSTVSQHLQDLKQVGLIKGEINGLHVNYCLDKEAWRAFQADWQAFLSLPIGDSPCDC